ncbi:MAG: cache domain-containing protein, partial [Desulfitobacteriaceae bacterium]
VYVPEGHPVETQTQPKANAKISQAEVEAKVNGLLTTKYPGEWKVDGTTLSKVTYTENGKYTIVDDIAALFPSSMGGVSIFIGEKRISSSIKQTGGERVLEGYPTPPTVGEVMISGKSTTTQSSGYLKVYIPLKAANKTLAVMTISVPE